MKSTCPKCGVEAAADGVCQKCLFAVGASFRGVSAAAVHNAAGLPTDEQLAGYFPQYEIQRLIGRGGMGAIYQARQTALDRMVAIKLIDRNISKDTMFVERFEREARVLAKLSHPNIVSIYDFGYTHDGLAYFVMEYVDGINLREAIDSISVEPTEAIDYVATMCKALHYAHSKGVVHRDIKPENILLGEDCSLKIADFGIARILDAREGKALTATRQVLGTLHYLAPEQIESPNEADHRVDLYSLGVVFYELLTKQLPMGLFEPPSSLDARIDRRLDTIVIKTLNRRPTLRYQSAEELEAAIDQVRSVVTNSPHPVLLPHHLSSCSVPFEFESMSGFAQAFGSFLADDEGIRIEYRLRDALFGTIKSKYYTIDIPYSRIV